MLNSRALQSADYAAIGAAVIGEKLRLTALVHAQNTVHRLRRFRMLHDQIELSQCVLL